MDFTDKVVLITGASSGIGAGTAEYFSKFGALLAIVGRNEENLAEVADKCGEPRPLTIVADLTIDDDIARIMETTIEHYGRLDVLVNNAGSGVYGSLEAASLNDFDFMVNVNLRSVFHLTKLAIPHLIKTKGSVVNVSSVLGSRAFANTMVYSISKAALNQFTQCLALELAPHGVRVNAIVPGVIVTNFQRNAGMSDETYAAYIERSKAGHALGRVGNVTEAASAIAFLAGDLSSFTTGALLPVDGGKHAMCPR